MTRTALLMILVLFTPGVGSAQSLGTFRWQLQSYCNVLSLVVTQNGGVFTLDGFDDQCGATTRAPAIGLATFNPNGTIEFGLTIVATPDAAPVHVAAAISVATLGGTWRDSAGSSGDFVFTPGAGTGGSPRPLTGAIGAASVNPSQVQLRIGGSCPSGSFMQSVTETGSVACAVGGDITGVLTGPGLVGGSTSGDVALSLRQTSSGAFDFGNNSSRGFVSSGSGFEGAIPVAESGPGTRLLWHSARSAFRAGRVGSTQWDLPNIGYGSVAMGLHTLASGDAAFAMGTRAEAAGVGSVALGSDVSASTNGTFMFGDRSTTTPMLTFAPNEFLVRAAGGTGIYSNASLTSGVQLASGGSQWAGVSDVNAKQHFRDVDGEDVLAKLARMSIAEWSYKTQSSSIRHMGPTAQEFHAAFGLGENPLRIGSMDADGVALRAIQALEDRTRVADERRGALEAEVAGLRERLATLERLLAERR